MNSQNITFKFMLFYILACLLGLTATIELGYFIPKLITAFINSTDDLLYYEFLAVSWLGLNIFIIKRMVKVYKEINNYTNKIKEEYYDDQY